MNELVDQYNNAYHCSINKNPIDADYSVSTEKTKTNLKLLNLRWMIEWELLSIIIFLVNIIPKNVQEKYSLLILFWKLILVTYKVKDINREKIIGIFYEKELLMSKLQMSYYPERNSHIRDNVKVVLDATKELYHATGADTSDLAAKKDFLALKAQVYELVINKFVNVSTAMNNC